MMMKFELPERYMKQSKGIIYVDTKQIISIMQDDDDAKDTFHIYLSNGNSWTVKGNFKETLKLLRRENTFNRYDNMSLKEMAEELSWLTQCGGIRSYFDKECCPGICVYDSAKLFNLFACCEEVAYEIEDGHFKKAEEMIDAYYKEVTE